MVLQDKSIRRRKYKQLIPLQTKRKSAVKYPEKDSFPLQTDKVIKESLHIFDTQKNKSMKIVIAYVAPKTR